MGPAADRESPPNCCPARPDYHGNTSILGEGHWTVIGVTFTDGTGLVKVTGCRYISAASMDTSHI